MTAPAGNTAQPKILTPAMVVALIALAVLAVVTIVVVVTGSDDEAPSAGGTTDPSGSQSASVSGSASASASASGSASASVSTTSSAPGPTTVTDYDLGARYTYVNNGYVEPWGGPVDLTAGIVDLRSIVTYPACTYAAGSDVLYALMTSDDVDLAQAATVAAIELGQSVWAGTGDATLTAPTTATQKTTVTGVTGYIAELNATRAGGSADECGTTTAHIVAFAFENNDGEVIVMVSSSRIDGDTLKTYDEFIDDVVLTFLSIELV